VRGCFWHIGYIFQILPYICWRVWGHEILGQVVSSTVDPSWNCLASVGASDSGMAMQPSPNFHHPSGRKCPSSVLNQAYSCGLYHGSIQLRTLEPGRHQNSWDWSPCEGYLFVLPISFSVFLSNCCISLLVPSVVYNFHPFRGPYRV
jgi:hypothetical protein